MWQDVSGGNDNIVVGKFRCPHAPTSGASTSRATTSRSSSATSRRRAQPAAPGQDAGAGRQRAAARRADQRPGRRDAARAEDALLESFAGSIMVISHDRWFLDRIDPHPRRRGRLEVGLLRRQLPGVQADKKKRLGEEGAKPHRVQGVVARSPAMYRPGRCRQRRTAPPGEGTNASCRVSPLGSCRGDAAAATAARAIRGS